MIDWTKAMQHTFEYYVVDPVSWKDSRQIHTVKRSSIDRDFEAETLGSASFDIEENLGECYIRTYLIASQDGFVEKIALGTHLVQTPSISFDGKAASISMDAYTPLLELKDMLTPIGYYIPKGTNVLDRVYRLTDENVRAPVIKTSSPINLNVDFVANTSESYLSFNSEALLNAKYRYDVDEMGQILFAPEQDTTSLNPIWTFNDDNSSILYPQITIDRDLYDIPNVVEVIYSDETGNFRSVRANNDPSSPVSVVNRGRRISHRVTNPSLLGGITQQRIDEYAERVLSELSTLEYTVDFSHGYCPVRIGDCVKLNYTRAGISNVKAKIIKQSISCTPGCPVSSTATFTNKLWR